MSEAQTLEQKLETRQIPRFDIPSVRTVSDFHGHTVEISRANTDQALLGFHRLMALLGPTLLKMVAWDDESAPTDSVLPTGLKELLELDIEDLNKVKSYALLRVLPAMKDRMQGLSVRDIGFLIDQLLVGHMRVSGVLIQTRADLDATGIHLFGMLPLLYEAIVVNCFPTFAGLPTRRGRAGKGQKSEPTESPKSPVTTKSSSGGATRRAGRSARTRKR